MPTETGEEELAEGGCVAGTSLYDVWKNSQRPKGNRGKGYSGCEHQRSCINKFSDAGIECPDRKQFRGGRICFGLQFQRGYSPP